MAQTYSICIILTGFKEVCQSSLKAFKHLKSLINHHEGMATIILRMFYVRKEINVPTWRLKVLPELNCFPEGVL